MAWSVIEGFHDVVGTTLGDPNAHNFCRMQQTVEDPSDTTPTYIYNICEVANRTGPYGGKYVPRIQRITVATPTNKNHYEYVCDPVDVDHTAWRSPTLAYDPVNTEVIKLLTLWDTWEGANLVTGSKLQQRHAASWGVLDDAAPTTIASAGDAREITTFTNSLPFAVAFNPAQSVSQVDGLAFAHLLQSGRILIFAQRGGLNDENFAVLGETTFDGANSKVLTPGTVVWDGAENALVVMATPFQWGTNDWAAFTIRPFNGTADSGNGILLGPNASFMAPHQAQTLNVLKGVWNSTHSQFDIVYGFYPGNLYHISVSTKTGVGATTDLGLSLSNTNNYDLCVDQNGDLHLVYGATGTLAHSYWTPTYTRSMARPGPTANSITPETTWNEATPASVTTENIDITSVTNTVYSLSILSRENWLIGTCCGPRADGSQVENMYIFYDLTAIS